ncbi:glycosyltransferase [Proteobacteria bacterium 005FR1]|nr:glycosyltransferase [Proteobacteria bacterium 005FR1]
MENVTVITANYNGRRFLARAIESVLNQSHDRIEYIIVDDGSIDDSKKVIEHYAAQDKRIKPILLSGNGGVARARNIGIENSTGDFVTFLDADDIWLPEKVERQLAVFRQHPRAGLVVTGAELIDENDRSSPRRKNRKKTRQGHVSLYDYIAGKCLLSINAMTRRECLDKSGLFNPDYVIGEDYELWMRITRDYDYYYVDEPLHRYRIHCNNTTRDKLANRESKVKILQDMLANNPELPEQLGQRFKTIMQRKYNSLGKAYYLAGRMADAQVCFDKALALNGSLGPRLKAHLWRMALRVARWGRISRREY